jgi:hypothetical protein
LTMTISKMRNRRIEEVVIEPSIENEWINHPNYFIQGR